MVPAAAIIALLIFIYFNRYVQRKRDERREAWRLRKEDQLERMLHIYEVGAVANRTMK
jgi:hypothetical protein